MDELKISELKLSKVLEDNQDFRFDSEYFKKEYVEIKNILEKFGSNKFEQDLQLLTDGKHGGVKETESGVIFLRTTNIKENLIDLSDLRFISEKESEETLRAEIKAGDILLTTIGSVGISCVVPNNFPRATINQNLVKIALNDKSKSNLISVFLNSKYGKGQTLRYAAGNVYQMINYPNLRKILIPDFSKSFQTHISELVQTAHAKLEESKRLYVEAEKILLDELGIGEGDFETGDNELNISIKNLSQSFGQSGRLDAEYYQSKYDKYESLIKNYKGGFNILSNIGVFKNGSFVSESFYSEKGKIPYVRIKELSVKDPINQEQSVYLDNNFELSNETTVSTGDFIFATIGNTIGKVNLIPEKIKLAIPSNNTSAFYLNKKENIEYYETLFRSFIVQEQIQRNFTQTAQPKISNKDLEMIIIPILPKKIQDEISRRVRQSFELRSQSKELLDRAKLEVEREIEKG